MQRAVLAALELCSTGILCTNGAENWNLLHVDLWRTFILFCKNSVATMADEVYLNNMLSRKENKSEQFGLEGTRKDHIVQPHCHGQGHLCLDQVAQSHPDPDHFQWWKCSPLDHLFLESKWERWIQLWLWATGGRVQTGVQHRSLKLDLWPLFTALLQVGRVWIRSWGRGEELLTFSMSLWSADRATATPPSVNAFTEGCFSIIFHCSKWRSRLVWSALCQHGILVCVRSKSMLSLKYPFLPLL